MRYKVLVGLGLVLVRLSGAHAGEPVVAGFDVIFANFDEPDQVCISTGSGLACGDVNADDPAIVGSRDVALGDVNEDGILDAVFAKAGPPNQVCLGNGAAGFSCSDLSPHLSAFTSVALADIDGDRHLDAVFTGVGVKDHVCLGAGDGTFACTPNPSPMISDSVVALGDVNNDGYPDALFGSTGSGVRVCLNNQSGAFPLCAPFGPASLINDIVVRHLDDDGNLDVVFTHSLGVGQLCLGNGAGGFTCGDLAGAPANSDALTIGNLLPGAPVEAVYGGVPGTVNSLWCTSNLGPLFSICFQITQSSNADPSDVGLIDLNGDGLNDLVIAHQQAANEVCFNSGTIAGGLFSSCTNVSLETNNTFALAVVVKEGVFADSFETIVPP